MNTELLVCKKLTAGLVFPPYQLNPNQVNKIYAEITERYPFQNLQHLPDGARMSNPNCDFFIQTNRLQVNDSVEFFHSSKERAIELMMMAQSRLNIPVFSTFGVKINAFLPMVDGRDAASVLEDTVFKSAKNSLNILGPGRSGIGMRVVMKKDGIYELKIEPFFNDPSQLFIELDIQYIGNFNDLKQIEPKMDNAYNYLFSEIKDFLSSLK